MKRTAAIILAVLFVAVVFVSCGRPEGRYVISTIDDDPVDEYIMDNYKMDVKEFLKENGILTVGDYSTVELKFGGDAVLSSLGVKADGTWEQDGETITVTFFGASRELTLKGKNLILDSNGTEVVYKKK